MKVDRKLMQIYRENPNKAREIFDTARNTSSILRSEVRNHFVYMGGGVNWLYNHNPLNKYQLEAIVAASLPSFVGMGYTIKTNTTGALVIGTGLSCAILLGCVAYLLPGYLGLREYSRSYSDAYKDALENKRFKRSVLDTLSG